MTCPAATSSGTWEADDVDNWVQCTSASRGFVARQYTQNLEMGLGDEIADPKAIHPEREVIKHPERKA